MKILRVLLGTYLLFDLLRCALPFFDIKPGVAEGLILAFSLFPGVAFATPLLWRAWRTALFRLVRALKLTAHHGVWFAILLGFVLLGQLAYFYYGDARGDWPSYSTVWPSFLAGPCIGALVGLIPLMQRDSRSVTGFLVMSLSLVWCLQPLALDFEYFFGSYEGWNAEDHLPVLSMALYSVTLYSLVGFGLLALLVYPAVLAGFFFPLWEWRKGRCSFVTAATCILAGFSLVPFQYEWIDHLLD
ncbi:MAG: hypothetical protein ACPG31_07645 [Planctomycetota bacterium]